MNLSSTIKSIQDIMRKDDGVDGDAQRIGQLTWMLFLKIFDQCEETWENAAADPRGLPLAKLGEIRRRRQRQKETSDSGERADQICQREGLSRTPKFGS